MHWFWRATISIGSFWLLFILHGVGCSEKPHPPAGSALAQSPQVPQVSVKLTSASFDNGMLNVTVEITPSEPLALVKEEITSSLARGIRFSDTGTSVTYERMLSPRMGCVLHEEMHPEMPLRIAPGTTKQFFVEIEVCRNDRPSFGFYPLPVDFKTYRPDLPTGSYALSFDGVLPVVESNDEIEWLQFRSEQGIRVSVCCPAH